MQITKKDRDDLLSVLPELPRDKADKIALINGCSSMTVYRQWKRIKQVTTRRPIDANNIIIAITELAASHKKESEKAHKKLLRLQRQLSAA